MVLSVYHLFVMRASAAKDLFYAICWVLSTCGTTSAVYEDLDRSDYRIELTPVYISASLKDIIIISVPQPSSYTLYYLTDPQGITTPLNITSKTTETTGKIEESQLETKFKIVNENFENSLSVGACNKTDFVEKVTLGPLSEDHHGNWVLSAYVKVDGGWMEVYQVVTIQITEHVPSNPTKPKLSPGETFEVSLGYPIDHLESCEIVAPRSTFDRSFDRSRSNLDSCGFRISNVTEADEGVWRIIGVGRIVYETTVFLEVNDVF